MNKKTLFLLLLNYILVSNLHTAEQEHYDITEQEHNAQLFKELANAIKEKNEELVKNLIRAYPNIVHATNQKGSTLLHEAAYYNAPSIAQILIDAGAVVDRETDQGLTPLHYAAFFGSDETANTLLANNMNKTIYSSKLGELPLHLASLKGHTNVVNQLLEHGDPRQIWLVSIEGETPLHYALKNKNPDTALQIATSLIQAGGDLYQNNKKGISPFTIAQENHPTLAPQLEKVANTIEQLFKTTRSNDIKSLQELLATSRIDSSVRNTQGESLLHIAAEIGADDIITELLSQDANSLAQDKNGKTALIRASEKGMRSAVTALLEHGNRDQVYIQDNDGSTALHYAIQNKNPDTAFNIASLLIRAGARTTIRDNNNRAPVHTARDIHGDKFLEELLELHDETVAEEELPFTEQIYFAKRPKSPKVTVEPVKHFIPLVSETIINMYTTNNDGQRQSEENIKEKSERDSSLTQGTQ